MYPEFSPSLRPPFADGVLGLGTGKTSILSQLSEKGIIKKVMALCLSEIDPGYLVLGDSQSNLPGIIWMPLSNNRLEPNNMLGPADLSYNGNLLASGLLFLFDSGTTFNYFSPVIYQAVLSKAKELAPTPTVDDPYLPICWRPFQNGSIFGSLKLSFTSNNNVYFELAPTDYIIMSPQDNVCLGILENQELGPEFENLNIMGDFYMIRKLMIFDHENQKIGWLNHACNQLSEQLSLTQKAMSKRSREKRMKKWHKGKDTAHWYTKKKRKLDITQFSLK
ncbi:aspartic proteinase Asp1-like [Olea europaea var. sylvestris]|uniref:aspartic proteinase Asp1-like n=1 Tax=Olea europaea var. sylvestris TaxID=158386 RepID=UPI000C1D21B5|nr:aspartic proteinase Asp1-like [Olea europaea var. sylvestris]